MNFGKPVVPGVNFSSAYKFDSVEELIGYHKNKLESVRYCRDSSDLVLHVESEFSDASEGWPALLTSSGMAAVTLVVESLLNHESRLISFGSFYRKTLSLFRSISKKYGVDFKVFESIEEYASECMEKEKDIVFIETPSNPFLRLTDVQLLRQVAKDALIIADATFQGISNDKGSLINVDIVLHSCTKYLSGHNDLIAGLVLFPNASLYESVWEERSMRGGIIDNMSAYLLQRSMKTYDLRIKAALQNTLNTLDWLHQHPYVNAIYYPGVFENCDQSKLFDDTHVHGGAVITFEVSPGVDIFNTINRVKTLKMAPSFGSVDSLVEIPAYMSHYGKNDAELAELGLSKQQIRLSVGVEPLCLIQKDLEAILSI